MNLPYHSTNPEAAQEWQVAVQLLHPSQRDLEHGLELHRSSLVAESYSLGIHAPIDANALNQELEQGATGAEYKDLREEQLMTRWVETPELRKDYREAWEAAGVSCLFINAGEEGNDPLVLLKRLARYTYLMDEMPDLIDRATSVEQIRSSHRNGKKSICLTLNGVPLAGNQQNVKDEMRYIRVFAQLGVRMMHLTYNRRNLIGDGCGEPRDGGLSDFGHAVVAEMNKQGMIIDLAHSGWQTCIDTTKATCQPVLVSHSAVHALNEHIRAKPDEVIKAVLDTGGTMGITNYPAFLGRSGDISAFLDHIDYMLQKFGSDSITIGTDRAFKHPDTVASHQSVQAPPRTRTRWESLWPTGDAIHSNQWQKQKMKQSLSWTNWPLFTVGMVQRGHSDETIRKILGENLLRVARSVWKTHTNTNMNHNP